MYGRWQRLNFAPAPNALQMTISRYHRRMKLPAMLFFLTLSLVPPVAVMASPVDAAGVATPVATDIGVDAGSVTTAPNAVADRTGSVLMQALSLIGVNYRFGGSSIEHGFDCSGFVRYVFTEAVALELPRSSTAMARLGKAVDRDQLEPGDLLFYNTMRRRASHVAIYLGDGRFVHAPSKGKQVEIVEMSDSYWKKRFNGARRLLHLDD